MDYRALKDRHRAERDAYHPNLSLRVHRALSWLDRAEQLEAGDDRDGRFIFLWMAFNAAYATEIDERYRLSQQETFRAFLQKLVNLGVARQRIEALVWTEFPKSAAGIALGRRDTVTVLSIVLSRIYTLRNQLMHGGATWGSSVNRDQLRDCTNLMGKLVPLVIEIMMDQPGTLLGGCVLSGGGVRRGGRGRGLLPHAARGRALGQWSGPAGRRIPLE